MNAKAGRKPASMPESKEVDISDAVIEQEVAANNQLAAMRLQDESNARMLASQLGYVLPADSTDPDLIQRDIAANMRRSVESCLEVGKGLAVLKAACGHGNFKARLDVLGIEESVARRFAQAAAKFSNRATSHDLSKAIGSQSKLFELLVLDDEQADELAQTGATAGITLDEVERMTVKELRAALREAREEARAKEDRRAALIQQNEDLREQLVRIKREKPEDALNAAQQEAAVILAEVLGRVRGDFRNALQVLCELDAQNTIYLAGMVGQVGAELAALREQFALPDLADARDAQLAAEVAQWALPAADTTPDSTLDGTPDSTSAFGFDGA